MAPLDGVTTEVPSKEVTSPWDVGSRIQGTTVPPHRTLGAPRREQRGRRRGSSSRVRGKRSRVNSMSQGEEAGHKDLRLEPKGTLEGVGKMTQVCFPDCPWLLWGSLEWGR